MQYFFYRYRSATFVIIGLCIVAIGILISILQINTGHDSTMPVVSQNEPALDSVNADALVAVQPQWDSMTISQHESTVGSFVQCVAKKQGASSIVIDPSLSAQAQDALHKLQQDTSVTLADVVKQPWYFTLNLESMPTATTACSWTDLEKATNGSLATIDHIGIAIAPPVGYAPASVLVIGGGK